MLLNLLLAQKEDCGGNWHKILWTKCPSCYSFNNVKALKGAASQFTDIKNVKKVPLCTVKSNIIVCHFPSHPIRYTHTRTLPFNGLFSRTTWVDRYQKDKPFWILQKQEMMGCQWHQLNHMQIICTSLQTDNHASTSSLHIFYRPDALPAAQPTASKH